MSKYLLIITIILGILISIGQTDKTTERLRILVDKLDEGYKLTHTTNLVVLYNDCDTLTYNKSIFTAEELRLFKKIWDAYNKHKRQFRIDLAKAAKADIGDVIYRPNQIKIYFVSSVAKALQGASAGLLNLSEEGIESARHSLNNNWIVYKTYILEEDTTVVHQQFAAGNIHYVVPTYCTLDSLRNYLNDPNSVPPWTEELP